MNSTVMRCMLQFAIYPVCLLARKDGRFSAVHLICVTNDHYYITVSVERLLTELCDAACRDDRGKK